MLTFVIQLSYNFIMIVFDSSTLILLARVSILELFVSDFNHGVLMPERVRLEVCSGEGEEIPLVVQLIENKKIEVLKAKDITLIKKLIRDFNIDEGEAEALTLALQEKAILLATDDRNAIRACKMLKLEFVTAIAILIRTFEKGLIDGDEAIIKLQKLKSIGRYSDAIIKNASEQIKGGI